jgi:hypothetical protein
MPHQLRGRLDAVFLNGAYAVGLDGNLEFRPLPQLSTSDVADALQIARARFLGYLTLRIHIA